MGKTRQELEQEIKEEMTAFLDNLDRYRKLKAEIDKLSQEADSIKVTFQPVVEAIGGKYQDEVGYVRIITRAQSVSFPGDQVDQLITTWAKSDNDIMKSCGQMLLNLRKVSQPYSYLQVK